jgi:hypothetical protein
MNVSELVSRANAGGHVEFRRLPTGSFIVDRWSIRYPVIARGVRRQRPVEEVASIKITGGDVGEVRRGSTVLWQRGLASLWLRVVDSATQAPVAGVPVSAMGKTATTAADGVVRLDQLTPGGMTVEIRAEWATSRILVDVRESQAEPVVARVPSERSVLAAACGERGDESGEGLVFGRTGANAGVRVSWRTAYRMLGSRDTVFKVDTRDVTADATGAFTVCGVPRDAAITVGTETLAFAPGRLTVAARP